MKMADTFPGDPGIAAALLLNPVTLQPGEALFVPAGSVHAYISGLGVEVMASSDNVLRAGLSAKHIDVPEMLACVDYVAAPPVRPAPEYLSRATRAYYAPVDDFELMVTTVVAADGRLPVPGRGPRILLAVEGAMTLVTQADSQTLAQGEAVFVGADEREPVRRGGGHPRSGRRPLTPMSGTSAGRCGTGARRLTRDVLLDALLPDGGRGDVVTRLGGEDHRRAPGAPGDQHLLEHLGRVGAAHQDGTRGGASAAS